MNYAADLAALEATHPDVARDLRGVTSMEKVLAWMKRRGVALDRLDLIAQDEYSHDLTVPLNPHGDWLVFGLT
jgi:hypothetical protein